MSNKYKKEEKKVVSIIIPNYNGEKLLKNNLQFVLRAKENLENNILEIIVVDDLSDDGSVALVKSEFPQVRLIKHKVNRGFSAAVNTGARSSKGKYLALLNTDVIPEKDFLASTLRHFSDESVFAVSLNEGEFSWAKGKFSKGFVNHEPGPKSKMTSPTFWANGGSGIFRRDMWMKLRGMDEALFSPFYWEDIDICYRAQKRGWKILWEPKARVEHKHESTISKLPKKFRDKIQERNQLLFIWKNITSPNLFRKHIAGLLKRVSRHPGYLKIVLMAMFKLRKVGQARKKEKKECKVSDEVIFARFT